MNDFNDLFKSFMKAGERVGENIGKFEMKCPGCGGIMYPMKKYQTLDIFFYMCGCGVDFPMGR